MKNIGIICMGVLCMGMRSATPLATKGFPPGDKLITLATEALMGGLMPGKRAYITELLVMYQANPHDADLYCALSQVLGVSGTDVVAQCHQIQQHISASVAAAAHEAAVQDVAEQGILSAEQAKLCDEVKLLREKIGEHDRLITQIMSVQRLFTEAIDETHTEDESRLSMRRVRYRHPH